MKQQLIDMLRCPLCGEPFVLADAAAAEAARGGGLVDPAPSTNPEILNGRLRCTNAHGFLITEGIPRLLPNAATSSNAVDETEPNQRDAARSIQTTYDAMWSRFQPGDREWAHELEERVAGFLTEVRTTEKELAGKLVLDAGCGPGTLTRAITRYGCESVGLDVSESVATAFQRSSPQERSRSHFLQGDLVNHPFRDGLFDIVYCGGVLHLNPDPRKAFQSLCRPLKPGGTMFIWVYRSVPGRNHAARQKIRNVLSQLPQRLRFLIILLWLPQAMLRQYFRTLFGRNNERDRLKWRERFVHLLDHYTPQYRWELEHNDVRSWFEEAGFEAIEIQADGMGFGVAATMANGSLPATAWP